MSSLAERIRFAMEFRNLHNKAELARASKVKPPSVSDWLSGKTQTLKAGTGRLAAEYFRCRRDWLVEGLGDPGWYDPPAVDQPFPLGRHHVGEAPRQYPIDHILSEPPTYAGYPQPAARVPVSGTVKMERGGEFREIDLIGPTGHVEAHSADLQSYAIRIIGDELHPYAKHGNFLVIEPDGECIDGENVLVVLRDGRALVRELGLLGPESVTLRGIIDGKRETISRTDIERLEPIASVVSASKWRPQP